MKRVINIGNKKQACEQLKQFKNKHYESIDIEFTNVHLLKLNELVGFKLFDIKKREPNGAPIAIPWILTYIMQYNFEK